MKFKALLVVAAVLLPAGPGFAGFDSWTAEVEDDPFSGGKSVTVSYSSSLRSGVFIQCDSGEQGVKIRAIPGFTYTEVLVSAEPEMQLAVDGKLVASGTGTTGSVGDNLAAVETQLNDERATEFVRAFAAAKKQIAIKDGISDRPHLLRARGSTSAGKPLLDCMKLQGGVNKVE